MIKRLLSVLTVGFLLAGCAKNPMVMMSGMGGSPAPMPVSKNKFASGPQTGLLAVRQYFFPCDSTTMPSKYESAAQAQANYLKAHPRARMQLQGFAASGESQGMADAIAAERALSVGNFIRSHGAYTVQVNEVSYGALTTPVYTGQNSKKDCRVDVVYLTP